MIKTFTNRINPAELMQLPRSTNPYTECGLCEKEHIHRNQDIFSPTYFSLSIDPRCQRICRAAEALLETEVDATSLGDILKKVNGTLAGRIAVRIACEMPILDYLEQNGIEALKEVYLNYGIPAALDQIRIMNFRNMDPEK